MRCWDETTPRRRRSEPQQEALEVLSTAADAVVVLQMSKGASCSGVDLCRLPQTHVEWEQLYSTLLLIRLSPGRVP